MWWCPHGQAASPLEHAARAGQTEARLRLALEGALERPLADLRQQVNEDLRKSLTELLPTSKSAAPDGTQATTGSPGDDGSPGSERSFARLMSALEILPVSEEGCRTAPAATSPESAAGGSPAVSARTRARTDSPQRPSTRKAPVPLRSQSEDFAESGGKPGWRTRLAPTSSHQRWMAKPSMSHLVRSPMSPIPPFAASPSCKHGRRALEASSPKQGRFSERAQKAQQRQDSQGSKNGGTCFEFPAEHVLVPKDTKDTLCVESIGAHAPVSWGDAMQGVPGFNFSATLEHDVDVNSGTAGSNRPSKNSDASNNGQDGRRISTTSKGSKASKGSRRSRGSNGSMTRKRTRKEKQQPRANVFMNVRGSCSADSRASVGVDEQAEEDSLDDEHAQPVRCGSQCIVNDTRFDAVITVLILLNSALFGVQAEFSAISARNGTPEPPQLQTASLIFCVCFAAELTLRLHAFGFRFFCNESWAWNTFDFVIVLLQVVEEIVSAATAVEDSSGESGVMPPGPSFLRMLRILRLVRVVRLVRLLRFLQELRTLVYSIASTVCSLAWTVVLILMMIYIMGICFTQVIADFARDQPDVLQQDSKTFHFFGSLGRSIMTMYWSITGGISWHELIDPLLEQDRQPIVAAMMAVAFCVYIAFALFCMLNVITGVFVESALNSAKTERTLNLVGRLRQVVANMGLAQDGKMRWEDFERQLETSEMEAYFRSLDLDTSDAKGLFELFDFDQVGLIDSEDFINGCIRIHGIAQSKDLVTLMVQVQRMHWAWCQQQEVIEEALGQVGVSVKTPKPIGDFSPSWRRGP